MAEDRILSRRTALKALLGIVGVAAGATALLGAGAAEAATPVPEIAPLNAEPAAAMAPDEALPESVETQYYYYRRRPRYVVRRRPVYRRPIYRRRVYRPVRRRYIRRVYF